MSDFMMSRNFYLPMVTLFSLLLLLSCVFGLAIAVEENWKLDNEESQDSISRLQEYLRIPTVHPNPDYTAATDFIISQATDIGLPAKVLEYVESKPIVLITWQGQNVHLPSILLNSHMDVVPVEESEWTHPPFAADIDENGNIFARGSQDMKSVGMQYLEAVRGLKGAGFVPLRSVHMVFLPDEETGGDGGAPMFYNSSDFSTLNVGIVLDEGLANPEDFYRVFVTQRLVWPFVIEATGHPGHGSRLYDNSALEVLREALDRIHVFREQQFDLWKTGQKQEGEVVSVNNVFLKAGITTNASSLGYVTNVQPSTAEAGFDMRVPPLFDVDSLEKKLSEDWAPAALNLTYTLLYHDRGLDLNGQPAITVADESNLWWVLLGKALERAGGRVGPPEIFPAGSDAEYPQRQGIPAFRFSPIANTPVLLHDNDEFLPVAEYLKGISVYEEIIKAYATYSHSCATRADSQSLQVSRESGTTQQLLEFRLQID